MPATAGPRPSTIPISTTASQGVAAFARIKLGPKGRSYALQVAADGLTATTVISLESKSDVAKSRKDVVQVVRASAQPAVHRAARLNHRQIA